jgi:hypothetical protein
VRARVEHVFGHQLNSMGGRIARTIGIVRARFKIGMMNLGYELPNNYYCSVKPTGQIG